MSKEYISSFTRLRDLMKQKGVKTKTLPLLPFTGIPKSFEKFRQCQLDYCNKLNDCDECEDLVECRRLYDILCAG
jgi:hypothetical protein